MHKWLCCVLSDLAWLGWHLEPPHHISHFEVNSKSTSQNRLWLCGTDAVIVNGCTFEFSSLVFLSIFFYFSIVFFLLVQTKTKNSMPKYVGRNNRPTHGTECNTRRCKKKYCQQTLGNLSRHYTKWQEMFICLLGCNGDKLSGAPLGEETRKPCGFLIKRFAVQRSAMQQQ